jgi:hypothetical protein
VAEPTEAVVDAGTWPRTDLVTAAFILYSLSTSFVTLKIKDCQNHGPYIRVTTGIVQLYIHDVYHSHW